MNKKTTIIITAIALSIIGIGAIVYIKTRPEPLTVCESLLLKMVEAKTQDEHDYAESRWRLVCLKPTNQP
jgi:hypothetical protein